MLFTRLGSPQNTSSTQLSADTAYSALWHLLITHQQTLNRIFTDCRYAALQEGSRSDWINNTCTHAMNKAPNSKKQAHAAHTNSYEFQKGLLMAVGYSPYTARGEMHWIVTVCVVLQLQFFFFFPRTDGSVPSKLIRADLLQIHTPNFITLSTTKSWILLMIPN